MLAVLQVRAGGCVRVYGGGDDALAVLQVRAGGCVCVWGGGG